MQALPSGPPAVWLLILQHWAASCSVAVLARAVLEVSCTSPLRAPAFVLLQAEAGYKRGAVNRGEHPHAACWQSEIAELPGTRSSGFLRNLPILARPLPSRAALPPPAALRRCMLREVAPRCPPLLQSSKDPMSGVTEVLNEVRRKAEARQDRGAGAPADIHASASAAC